MVIQYNIGSGNRPPGFVDSNLGQIDNLSTACLSAGSLVVWLSDYSLFVLQLRIDASHGVLHANIDTKLSTIYGDREKSKNITDYLRKKRVLHRLEV